MSLDSSVVVRTDERDLTNCATRLGGHSCEMHSTCNRDSISSPGPQNAKIRRPCTDVACARMSACPGVQKKASDAAKVYAGPIRISWIDLAVRSQFLAVMSTMRLFHRARRVQRSIGLSNRR